MLVEKITMVWLEEKEACIEGMRWFKSQLKTDSLDVLNALIDDNQLDWANWLIVRVMDRPQYIAYAIFAAEQVLDIFERAYPDEKYPRQEIEAARAILKNDNEVTMASSGDSWAARAAAGAAAWAAWSAARAAARDAARAAARAAAWSAWAARAAARVAARDAVRDAAGAAAVYAAELAMTAVSADGDAMIKRILQHGISLLEKEKVCAR